MVFRCETSAFHDMDKYSGGASSLLKLHAMAIVDNIYRFLEQAFAKDFGRSSAQETQGLTKSFLKHYREDTVTNRKYMQELIINEKTLAGQMAVEELRASSAEKQAIFNMFGNIAAAVANPLC